MAVTVAAVLALVGSAEAFSSLPIESLPTSYNMIIASCMDIVGPTMVSRIAAEGNLTYPGELTAAEGNVLTKEHYSKAWAYMQTLGPDAVFLLGDNVYNDDIANWGLAGSPVDSIQSYMTDADAEFYDIHGFGSPEKPGPVLHSFLDILKDKLQDGYSDNEEFRKLQQATNDHVHITWDDHDYLSNDPSNPHFLQSEFRRVAIDELTGVDRDAFRQDSGGIERSWTKTLNNKGRPFVVRFIILDEETTHAATFGMKYVYSNTSTTGFKPVRASGDDTTTATLNADPAFMDDFDEPVRPFFGASQLEWLKTELRKPADLRLIFNGGPNFEIDYSYAALTDFPGAKRLFVEALRETQAEHVVFFGGDSHASYITKVPDLLPYPAYTIIGSGITQGLSYDRYVGYWGDISHRHLIAAGSTARNDDTASFAQVTLEFDPEPMLTFIPHLADDGRTNGDNSVEGRWGEWYAQTEPNAGEPWDAKYTIRLSELVNAPNAVVDNGDFVTETIGVKWAPAAGAAGVAVELQLTNANGETKSFELQEGGSSHLCGTGYFGFCKDIYGSFTYNNVFTPETYQPSRENRALCEHAGLVGTTVQWTINARNISTGAVIESISGSNVLKFRNNVLIDVADTPPGAPYNVVYYNNQHAYGRVAGPGELEIGMFIGDVINVETMYGGHKIAVRGYDDVSDTFDAPAVQSAYASYKSLAANDPADEQALTNAKIALANAFMSEYYSSVVNA